MPVTVEVSISERLTSELSSEAKLETKSEASESADDGIPESDLLQSWASAAYLDERPAIASLLVTGSEEIRELNKQYRDKDKPTNVLSFPMQSPEEVDVCLLGDIVLCAPVIRQEAEQQAKSELSHWAHMVVHGMLHLQGYDHIENDEAEEMEQLEMNVLKQLGFDDPYKISPEIKK
ncbi:MAG: rRNA maturation RNase YbeY [Gammaproteobacteria bacterium]|nr:rRNA maturation RNase YbeY [Gammaproteobacteria bacterium]